MKLAFEEEDVDDLRAIQRRLAESGFVGEIERAALANRMQKILQRAEEVIDLGAER